MVELPNIEKMDKEKDVKELIKSMKYKDYDIRIKIQNSLTSIGEPAVEPLIHALNDKNNRVRWIAATILGDIGDKKAVEPLIKTLNDRDHDVREKSVVALGKIKDERAIEPLIKTLKDEWYIQDRAIKALAKTGTPAVEPLINALNNRNAHVKEGAAKALGEIGDKKAVQPLIKLLKNKPLIFKDTKSNFRSRAAEALGKIGDRRAVNTLIQHLEDKNSFVQIHAADALSKIGDPRAIEPLLKLIIKDPLFYNRLEPFKNQGYLNKDQLEILEQKRLEAEIEAMRNFKPDN